MTGSAKTNDANLDEKLIHGNHSDEQPTLKDPGPCNATLHVPYQEWYSAKSKYYPPALLDITGESTPVNFMSNMAHANTTDTYKRSIPVQIITRLLDRSPSLRGIPITFEYPERNGMTLADKKAEITRAEKQASDIAFDLLRIRLLETTMSKIRDKWSIIQTVLPPVSTRDTGWEYCCSLLNNFLSRSLIGFEYDFRVLGGALMQPMRHLRIGRIFGIKDEDGRGIQAAKRLSQVSFGLLIALPLAIIAQPFFLIGNILASLQGFTDGVCTLLGCAWNNKENKKAIVWTSLKTIFKSLVQLIPTIVTIALYFTPAAPAVAGIMTANSLGLHLSASILLGSAYSFVSCVITGAFDFLATKLTRFLDTLSPKKLSVSLPPSPIIEPLHHLEGDVRNMDASTLEKNYKPNPAIPDDPFIDGPLDISTLPSGNEVLESNPEEERQPGQQQRIESLYAKSPNTKSSTAYITDRHNSENIHQSPTPRHSRDSASTSTTDSNESDGRLPSPPPPQPTFSDSGQTSPTESTPNKGNDDPYSKIFEALFNRHPDLLSKGSETSKPMSYERR